MCGHLVSDSGGVGWQQRQLAWSPDVLPKPCCDFSRDSWGPPQLPPWPVSRGFSAGLVTPRGLSRAVSVSPLRSEQCVWVEYQAQCCDLGVILDPLLLLPDLTGAVSRCPDPIAPLESAQRTQTLLSMGGIVTHCWPWDGSKY